MIHAHTGVNAARDPGKQVGHPWPCKGHPMGPRILCRIGLRSACLEVRILCGSCSSHR
jgi:hypothetical protein